MLGPAEVAHGPMFIGLLMNVLLYGIMITQVYIYFTNYKKYWDKKWMKLFVLLLLLCDTVNSIFDSVYLYGSLILHFSEVAYLGKANWVFATDPVMTAIIAILVQGFFAWRVKVLTSNKWLMGLVLATSLAGFLGGVITSFEVGRTPEFVNFRDFKWAVIMWLVGSCCGDVMITVILVWHLRRINELWDSRRGQKTGFQASDAVVDRIIRMTVQTGLITAVCAIIDLVLFLVDPTGLHLIFNFPLSKLYTNSLMSSLNSRGVWGHSKGPSLRYSLPTSVPVSADQQGSNKISMQEVDANAKVFVHVESHQTRDAEGAARASITRPSGNEPRISVNRVSLADVQQMTAPPTAMSGLHRDRHESRVPFETYNQSLRSNSPGSIV